LLSMPIIWQWMKRHYQVFPDSLEVLHAVSDGHLTEKLPTLISDNNLIFYENPVAWCSWTLMDKQYNIIHRVYHQPYVNTGGIEPGKRKSDENNNLLFYRHR